MGRYRKWTCGMCLRKMLCLSYRPLKSNANILHFLKKKKELYFFVVQSVQTLLLARDFLRAKVSNEIAFSKFSKRMSATGDEAGYSARKNKPFYFHGNFVCPYNLGVSSTYYFFCLLSLSLPNVSG